MEKIVCPPKLRGGLFTTAAIDNIDHNLCSTTAQGSFHGTGISLFQHPSTEKTGFQRITPVPTESSHSTFQQGLARLPQSYTSLPPFTLSKKHPVPPKLQGTSNIRLSAHVTDSPAMQTEYKYAWLACRLSIVGSSCPSSVCLLLLNMSVICLLSSHHVCGLSVVGSSCLSSVCLFPAYCVCHLLSVVSWWIIFLLRFGTFELSKLSMVDYVASFFYHIMNDHYKLIYGWFTPIQHPH